MKKIKKSSIAFLLPLLVAAWGCESTALVGRRDVDRRGTERERVYRGDRDARDRDLARDEVAGIVERIDDRRDEIELRTRGGRTMVVKYDSGTRVRDRDRDRRVRDLRRGDFVVVRLDRDSGGEQYAQVIRIDDRGSDAGFRR
jgi:hypothetical protein